MKKMISILIVGFLIFAGATGSLGDLYFCIPCAVLFLIACPFEIKFEKKIVAHFKKVSEIKDLEREVKKAELQKKLTELQNH